MDGWVCLELAFEGLVWMGFVWIWTSLSLCWFFFFFFLALFLLGFDLGFFFFCSRLCWKGNKRCSCCYNVLSVPTARKVFGFGFLIFAMGFFFFFFLIRNTNWCITLARSKFWQRKNLISMFLAKSNFMLFPQNFILLFRKRGRVLIILQIWKWSVIFSKWV